MKRNGLQFHATTCTMFKSIMLVKDTRHKIPQTVQFHTYEKSRKGISVEIQSKQVAARGGEREQVLTANRFQGVLGGGVMEML